MSDHELPTLPDLEITRLLNSTGSGRSENLNIVIESLYQHLNQMAAIQLHKAGNNMSINTNDLVHELYLKLNNKNELRIKNRQHFFALAATAMRHLIVDRIKYKSREKHGGDFMVTTISDKYIAIEDNKSEIITVNDSMDILNNIKPALAQTVECRFFAGYSESETAEIIGVSVRTIRRYWVTARNIIRQQQAN